MTRVLGDASDILPLPVEAIAETQVFASLAVHVQRSRQEKLWGFGGLAVADGLPLAGWDGQAEGLLVVARSATPSEVASLFVFAASRRGLDLCFLDYVTWLPGIEKNPLVAVINRLVRETPSARLSAFIVDPEGLPRIVVTFRPPPSRPSAGNPRP